MKRAIAAVLALAALGASVLPFESEARDRRCRLGRANVRTGDCVGYAFFEAFPTSGAGTSGACSTTAPTGAKGEALTFTRASTAYCTKTASGGLATTGIADGDLVSVSNNVARQEYDSAGVLGLRVEGARTNSILQSQATDVSPWVAVGVSGSTAPTFVSGNNTSPDGTATADRWQFSACPGAGAQSIVYQTTALTAAATHSIYVKSVTASASISICGYTTGTGNPCVTCSANSSTWTRCSVYWSSTGAPQLIVLGCNNNAGPYSGASNTGAADVLLWNAQTEAGAYMTSPILTTTAAQTRVADTAATFPVVSSGLSTGSAAFAWTPAGTGVSVGQMSFSGNARMLYGAVGNILAFDGTNNPSTAANGVAGTTKRYWSSWSTAGGWVVRNDTDANQATSAFSLATWTAALDNTLELVGVAGIQPDGIISRVCLDPDTTRCR